MKYLKSFNESSNLYEEMTADEFVYYQRNRNIEKVTKKEINKLQDEFPNVDIFTSLDFVIEYRERSKGISGSLTKYDDEWYTLKQYHKKELLLYKCDTINGVIELLKIIT